MAINTDEDARVTFQVTYPAEPKQLDALLAQLQIEHESLLRDYGETQVQTSEIREQLTDFIERQADLLADTQVADLEKEGLALAQRKQELALLAPQKTTQIEQLEQALRDQEFRRKNADQLVGLAERETKERIEAAVKEEREVAEWKKRIIETQAELKRAKQDLEHETQLTVKRDEQLQLLLTQLQKREAEQEQLRRDLRRKEDEHQRLQQRLTELQEQTLSLPTSALEEARGIAEARQGEVAKVRLTQIKEVVRGYHQQLRQKQTQLQHLRKQTDSVRLPPLNSAGSGARKSIGI